MPQENRSPFRREKGLERQPNRNGDTSVRSSVSGRDQIKQYREGIYAQKEREYNQARGNYYQALGESQQARTEWIDNLFSRDSLSKYLTKFKIAIDCDQQYIRCHEQLINTVQQYEIQKSDLQASTDELNDHRQGHESDKQEHSKLQRMLDQYDAFITEINKVAAFPEIVANTVRVTLNRFGVSLEVEQLNKALKDRVSLRDA